MSKRLTPALSATMVTLGLLGPVAAFAAIPVAPARFDEALRIFTSTPRDGVSGADIAQPESVPESFLSAGGTTFSGVVTTTAAPTIEANLAQTGGDGNFVATAGIVYQFAYEGPATSTLPVFIFTSGAVSVTGASASASVSIEVRPLLSGPSMFFRQVTASTFGTASNSFTVNSSTGPLLLEANAVYQVVMGANLSVADAAAGPGTTAKAFLDPTFVIDPGFANAGQYTFFQSAGIAAVAEPGKVTLLCVGGLLLAVTTRHRRRFTGRLSPARQ
ncbi:MAG: hypothetical protein K2Y35_18280 [Burkholderiales bacterium]|nr:hypothetical protein [Burkholderiales bacterium]